MSTDTSVLTRITSPASLAATLPTLLGFTPIDSLVIVFVKDTHVVVTMRTDLADITHSINDYARTTALRVGADSVLIATYTSNTHDPLSWRSLVMGLNAVFADADVAVLDALSIVGEKYWGYLDKQDFSRPIEGSPFTPIQSMHSDRETLTREDIVARYLPQPDLAPSVTELSRAIADAEPDVDLRAEHTWQSITELGSSSEESAGTTDRLRARLMVWLQNVQVRDYILCTLAATKDDADSLVNVVVDAALRSPVDLRPRIAGLAAAALAATSSSTIPASCMVDLAGDDSLAQLVGRSIAHAVPPSTLRELFAEGLTDVQEAMRSHQHN